MNSVILLPVPTPNTEYFSVFRISNIEGLALNDNKIKCYITKMKANIK